MDVDHQGLIWAVTAERRTRAQERKGCSAFVHKPKGLGATDDAFGLMERNLLLSRMRPGGALSCGPDSPLFFYAFMRSEIAFRAA